MISLALGIVCLILVGLLLLQRSWLRYTSRLLNDAWARARVVREFADAEYKDLVNARSALYRAGLQIRNQKTTIAALIEERDRLRKELAELKRGISCTKLD